MSTERIIAVGLLSQSDRDRLGSRFARMWPVDETVVGQFEIKQD